MRDVGDKTSEAEKPNLSDERWEDGDDSEECVLVTLLNTDAEKLDLVVTLVYVGFGELRLIIEESRGKTIIF